MISDDERRAVAARMREILRDDPHGWLDAMVMNAVTDVIGEGVAIGGTVADLIDRPTCRICATDHEYEDSVRCDRCRMTFRRPWEPFKYCPNCGAEVKDDAEPNLKEN
ncbi:hypothetical protein [Paratractidigestivibacter faecalis]|uniref:hypothetical protein n=1 Tax=Paratractidigestivibacter faecalis TaxID=2292441 RepID=UPI003A95AC3A